MNHPKFTFILILTLVLSQFDLQAQWRPTGEGVLPDTQRVASISIVDASIVWGVAFYDRTPAPVPSDLMPYVIRTTTSGGNWEAYPIEEVQGRITQDIFAVDENTAWITTNGLVSDSLRGIFKTEDGGTSWVEKFDGPAGGGMIHFFDDTIGVAIHDNFAIYTFDGGENWENIMPSNSLPFEPMESSFYTATNNAFAIVKDTIWFGTTQGRVFRSVNRGFEWEAFDTPFESNDVIISTAFRNANEGMIISYASSSPAGTVEFMDSTKVALTFDGGVTWELADTLFNFKVNCITAVPGTDYRFIGASNGLSTITLDTAKTWDHFSFRPYNSIDFFNGELGWVGNSQTSVDHPAIMYKWEGIVSSTENIELEKIAIQVFPNPSSDFFNIKISEADFEKYKKEDLSIEVFDLLGHAIFSQKINTAVSQIYLSNSPNGIYFYVLKNRNGVLGNGKLIFKN